MIAAHRAIYHSQSDKIEVAVVLQEDDGTSLSPRLQTGTVTLLHVGNTVRAVTFGPEHVVKQIDEDDENAVTNHGEFYVFFMHPSAQRHLSVKLEVETTDGATITAVTPIEVDASPLPEPNENQNPSLPGHDIIEYPQEVDKP